jgi:heme/copper-type cytochrome/quinol oxidase subunit 3
MPLGVNPVDYLGLPLLNSLLLLGGGFIATWAHHSF